MPNELDDLRAEVADLRAALRGLASGSGRETCWCEASIGNPMVPDHTRACVRARKAMWSRAEVPHLGEAVVRMSAAP